MASMIVPGNSALRTCERILRENGVLVIPDQWNNDAVLKYLREKVSEDVSVVSQPDLGLTGILGMTVKVYIWKGGLR